MYDLLAVQKSLAASSFSSFLSAISAALQKQSPASLCMLSILYALPADWYRSCASSNLAVDELKKEKPDDEDAFLSALGGGRTNHSAASQSSRACSQAAEKPKSGGEGNE